MIQWSRAVFFCQISPPTFHNISVLHSAIPSLNKWPMWYRSVSQGGGFFTGPPALMPRCGLLTQCAAAMDVTSRWVSALPGDLNSTGVLVYRVVHREGGIWGLCALLIRLALLHRAPAVELSYWIASVRSAKHDLAALYKAVWPTTGRPTSTACLASLSALLHTALHTAARNNSQSAPKLYEYYCCLSQFKQDTGDWGERIRQGN